MQNQTKRNLDSVCMIKVHWIAECTTITPVFGSSPNIWKHRIVIVRNIFRLFPKNDIYHTMYYNVIKNIQKQKKHTVHTDEVKVKVEVIGARGCSQVARWWCSG